MGEFDSFFLMDTESVKRYAVEVLHLFAPGEETVCEEIGDGNINYVFRIRSLQDGHSAVVKQADRLLRSSGRLLDQNRSRIEAAILKLEGELAPGFVPEVYHYDEVMAATAMEDVSAFGNLRRELAANRVYPHLSENLPVFMVDTLLPVQLKERKGYRSAVTGQQDDFMLVFQDGRKQDLDFAGQNRVVQFGDQEGLVRIRVSAGEQVRGGRNRQGSVRQVFQGGGRIQVKGTDAGHNFHGVRIRALTDQRAYGQVRGGVRYCINDGRFFSFSEKK